MSPSSGIKQQFLSQGYPWLPVPDSSWTQRSCFYHSAWCPALSTAAAEEGARPELAPQACHSLCLLLMCVFSRQPHHPFKSYFPHFKDKQTVLITAPPPQDCTGTVCKAECHTTKKSCCLPGGKEQVQGLWPCRRRRRRLSKK